MSVRYDCRDAQTRTAGIEAAVTAARAGELIVLPTDTLYGVGSDAFTPAAVTTMLARHQQVHVNILGAYVNQYDPQARQALEGATAMFMRQGSPPSLAQQQALQVISGSVQRQASMLSFLDVFKTLGGLFLCMLPLVLLMKPPRKRAGGGMAAGH